MTSDQVGNYGHVIVQQPGINNPPVYTPPLPPIARGKYEHTYYETPLVYNPKSSCIIYIFCLDINMIYYQADDSIIAKNIYFNLVSVVGLFYLSHHLLILNNYFYIIYTCI